MTDGTNVSQIESGNNDPQAASLAKQERRSERRLMIDGKINSTVDWLTSLQRQVDEGKITSEERNKIIARTITARDLLAERARGGSKKDPMTGLLNVSAFREEIGKLIDNVSPFGLLIIDIDHFKAVNDRHGHAAGDSVLTQTAENLTSHLRQTRTDEKQNDKIFRYGGEEFAVLLPGINNEADLMAVAEKIRNYIENFPYSVKKAEKNIDIPLTVSIGGGINRREPAESFFERVDVQGLYNAKETGRNKTIIVPEK